ncbi:hypothetical protein QFC21_001813 [Naganishia friedmannii]|uniref:Uncharacterized protein n=1 Tax=Naganishia friedmannii TaxID=89922 RepID=A0ACC2W1G1_9TREE|nr:hypothetical protein QFC21_001813 [Naganishia friedmannii]
MSSSTQREPTATHESEPEINSVVDDQNKDVDAGAQHAQKGKETTARDPQLRYCEPYYHPYRTSVKQRWIGRQILEVISTEFRDRSVDYYRHALASGVTKVNGKVVGPEYILKNGDRIEHEPPVTISPILLLHRDDQKQFIVISKPGSVPVHATGRYFKHTVLEMLKSDLGITAYSVNRLDRLTSGLMILALTGKASTGLAEEFIKGHVKKEYLARVNGKFPEEEIVVDQSLLTIDRQMGVVICTPDGKDAKTIFKRLHYDAKRNQSVVHSHQIRVHLQYIGHPIVNDPLYGTSDIWGPNLGKGGVDLTPDITDEDAETTGGPDTPATIASVEARMQGKEALPSAKLQQKFNWKLEKELMKLRANGGKPNSAGGEGDSGTGTPQKDLLPREMEDDTVVGGSPIYLSREAREIVSKLRRQKDEQEDWAKWSEVVYKMKEAAKLQSEDDPEALLMQFDEVPEGFCAECHIPLAPDPKPDTLFIYLHAWRYTTERLGCWETPMPKWADEDWDGLIA